MLTRLNEEEVITKRSHVSNARTRVAFVTELELLLPFSTMSTAMDTTPDQTAATSSQPPKPEEPVETWDDIPDEIKHLGTDEILTRIRLLDNDLKVCVLMTDVCDFQTLIQHSAR